MVGTRRTNAEQAIDEHLGRRLLARRRGLGLTQQVVANAIGVRFQQIQKYECGASRMSPARLWALSEALNVQIGYFFDGLIARPDGCGPVRPCAVRGLSEALVDQPVAKHVDPAVNRQATLVHAEPVSATREHTQFGRPIGVRPVRVKSLDQFEEAPVVLRHAGE
jgi:DNA-binding XRE family transcriptional regulator